MSRKKKLDPEIVEVVSGRWMMTFSDLLTLLLAFFVLLLTMSSMDQRKFQEAFGMFAGAFGTLAKQAESGMAPDFIVPINAPLPEILVKDIEDVLERTLREELPEQLVKPDVNAEPAEYRDQFETEVVEHGVEVRIAGDVMFEPGTSRLRDQSRDLLLEVAGDVVRAGVPTRVKSYVPPGQSRREMAWELSLDRAAVVVDLMQQVKGLDPTLLSLMGYGRRAPRTLKLDRDQSVVVLTFFNRSMTEPRPVEPADTKEGTDGR